MPKTDNLKPAKTTNPKWLDTARLFYSESFGALKKRELRASKDDWSDLTEEEQSFALAHLQYLGLMAEAGTQRLLVQVRDLLEEIADGLAAERVAPADATGADDEGDDDEGDDNDEYDEPIGDEDSHFTPPVLTPAPASSPFTHSIPQDDEAPAQRLGDSEDEDEPDGGGGRAA